MFKSKRQRGEPPPPPLEDALHIAIADVLRRWCSPAWRYTHFPAGEYRRAVTGAKLKRMGLVPGFPDFFFFQFRGRVAFLELKRRGARATEAQEAIGGFLERAGHGYLISDSFDDVLAWLKAQTIVPAKISTWNDNTNLREAPTWPPREESVIG